MRRIPLPGVFQPHSDSLMLAERLRNEPLPTGARVLDLCTGSGVLAISAAQGGRWRVTAVDISRRAVLATRLNARLNRVTVRALRGDLFAPITPERFDLIVSNPPYIPSVEDQLPDRGPSRAWEAGPRGRVFLDRICAQAPAHLNPGGVVLLVHSSICSEQATIDALSAQGLNAQIVFRSPGPLGKVVRARAPILRARGLLPDPDSEDIVIVRAVLAGTPAAGWDPGTTETRRSGSRSRLPEPRPWPPAAGRLRGSACRG
jgi:release factor glutamine methyltransferase